MIISYSVTRERIEMPCPQCEVNAEVDIIEFLRAINRREVWHCVDCGCNFMVEVTLLDPPARTPDTAETPIRGALEYCQHISEKIDGTCPYCNLPKRPTHERAFR